MIPRKILNRNIYKNIIVSSSKGSREKETEENKSIKYFKKGIITLHHRSDECFGWLILNLQTDYLLLNTKDIIY